MLRRRSGLWCAIGALLGCTGLASVAQAQTAFISEVFSDAPSTDNGFEAIEITGVPGTSLNGWALGVIDGDGAVAGLVLTVVSLNGMTLGSNGVLLIRDAATNLLPAPDSDSTVVVMDFNPDIQNGTQTYVLGMGTFPAVGSDLDSANDGTLDAPLAGFTVVDAVAYTDGFATDAQYADDVGFPEANLGGVNPQAIYRILTNGNAPLSWAGGRVTGSNPGPYNWSALSHFGWVPIGIDDPTTRTLDLGTLNYAVILVETGACCFANGTCAALTESECGAQGGLYQGDGTDCKSVVCTQPSGACCLGDDSCVVTTPADCETMKGTYQGDNTPCEPKTCMPENGACCFANGSCVVTTSDDCTQQGGTYLGNGISCKPNQCLQPTGSCCLGDGTCLVTTMVACIDQGGTYQGDGTLCDPTNCPQPLGACCYVNGNCVLMTAALCAVDGGAWKGPFTSCEPNNCAQPMGACCFTNGTCVVTTEPACANQGGAYQGEGSVCKPNNCPQPRGACCFADGGCSIAESTECMSLGGMYSGDGTVCDPNKCPQPSGACCFLDGSCFIRTPIECLEQGGSFQGPDTTCDTANCPQPTGACCLGDGSCVMVLEEQCITMGGIFSGLMTECGTVTCTPATPGALYLSELFFNSVGGDQGQESIEIVGPADFNLDGWFLLVIEGDGNASGTGAGTIDQRIRLSGLGLGSNGILLIRDSATVFAPAPAEGTVVVTRDFVPDIENGSNTYVLGYGRLDPLTGADLDTDNNGVIDVPLGNFTAVDAVSFSDPSNAPSVEYADEFGGTNLGGVTALPPGALYRILDSSFAPFSWAGGFTTGTSPGPFFWSASSNFGFTEVGIANPAKRTLDLGTLNYVFGGFTGGCCLADGTCSVVTESACADLGGTYRGDNTDCTEPCPTACPCDWNESGELNSQDFFDYLADFFDNDADFNESGETNSQDYFDFLTCFFIGC